MVEQQSIRRFRGWKVKAISLLVVGGVGTILVVTGSLNQPQVAPVLQEQIRSAPAPQVKPNPQVLPHDQTHIDPIATLVAIAKVIALLEMLLGVFVILQAASKGEDLSPGIGMVVFGVIITFVISAYPSFVASLATIGTNNKSTSLTSTNNALTTQLNLTFRQIN